VHWYSLGRRLQTADVAHGVDQRLPVMRPGAPHKRSIDIEEDQVSQEYFDFTSRR
jgi:hypothetical protein